jgi:hypothetical protein
MKLKLFLSEIADRFVRENFKKLDDYLATEPFRKGEFRFFERELATDTAIGYPATVTFTHGFGKPPKDVIVLSVSPDTVTLTPKYDSFTRTHVAFEVSAACTLRAFIGRYEETN